MRKVGELNHKGQEGHKAGDNAPVTSFSLLPVERGQAQLCLPMMKAAGVSWIRINKSLAIVKSYDIILSNNMQKIA